MTMRLLAATFLAAVLAGCGSSNTSTPGIDSLAIRENFARPGETLLVDVTFRMDATDTDGGFTSDPFFAVVTLPPGAAYQDGSSRIVFGPVQRAPDELGVCPDGRTYLSYRFAAGEFDNRFEFDEFSSPIEFRVTVSAAADEAEVTAVASDVPLDPCVIPEDAHRDEFNVNV